MNSIKRQDFQRQGAKNAKFDLGMSVGIKTHFSCGEMDEI